jgi:hypothetical protein
LNERKNALDAFKKTKKTRLVFNVNINSKLKIDAKQFAPGELEAYFPFPK